MTAARRPPSPRPGSDGPVTLRSLAEHLKLSPASISLVLNQAPGASAIPRQTQERILAAARRFQYRPNTLARSLRRQRSLTVGVLVPEISEGYSTLVLRGIEDRLLQEGYLYFITSHRHHADLLEEYPKLLLDRAIEGLIAVDTPCRRALRVPVVAVSGHGRTSGVTNVCLNHDRAALAALGHLRALGHERIAVVRGQAFSSDTAVRWRTIQEAAGVLGITLDPRLLVQLEGDRPLAELGRRRHRRPAAARRAVHGDVHLQRHVGLRRDCRARRRRQARAGGRLGRRLRRHPERRVAQPAADDHSPAAPADGRSRRRDARRAHQRRATREVRADDRGGAGAGRPRLHRAGAARPRMTPPPADRRAIVLLHAVFVVAGMATTLLGPMMPLLLTRWSLTDAEAGSLFTAQFAGQMSSTFLSSLVTRRLGDRHTLVVGLAVTAVGVAAMSAVPWPAGIAAALLYGLGLGLVLPITNFVVAALRPANAAAALSLLNVSWGVGAVLWPLVVGLTVPGTAASAGAVIAHGTSTLPAAVPGTGTPLLILSGLTAALAAVLALERGWPESRRPAAAQGAGAAGAGRARVAALVATFAALAYLYVGTETSIGGWIAEFTRRAGPSGGTLWALAPTAFWGAETLGRLGAPLVLRKISEEALLVAGLGIAGVAVLLLVGSSGMATAIAGAVLAGVGLAPIFPLLIAAMTRHVAPSAPGMMGPLFAMGGLGGATLPWLVGLASSRTGQLRTGLLVPLAALAVMAALQANGRRIRGTG